MSVGRIVLTVETGECAAESGSSQRPHAKRDNGHENDNENDHENGRHENDALSFQAINHISREAI